MGLISLEDNDSESLYVHDKFISLFKTSDNLLYVSMDNFYILVTTENVVMLIKKLVKRLA